MPCIRILKITYACFFEQWEDQASIDAHFVLPSSQAFVAEVRTLVSAQPNLHIFSAEKIK